MSQSYKRKFVLKLFVGVLLQFDFLSLAYGKSKWFRNIYGLKD